MCRRRFDGSEPVIGDVPGARRPYRLADVLDLEAQREAFEPAPWHRVRAS